MEAPEGWREITEKDFAQSMFFVYAPKEMKYLGTVKAGDVSVHSVRAFYFHDDTGLALSNDYWAGKVRYFAFGCKHKYREIHREECLLRGIFHGGTHWHVEVCQSCGYVNNYDSS